MQDFRELEPIVPASRRRRDIDAAIDATIARQDGPIADHQLEQIGLSPRRIGDWVRAHRLYEADVGTGIYTRTPEPLRGRGRRTAALLWAPEDGVLADTTAAASEDLERHRGQAIHVGYVGDRRSRPVRGIAVHRFDPPSPADVYVNADGCRSTRGARTILDIAGRKDCTQHRADALVDRSVGLRIYDQRAFDRVRRERPSHPGITRLNAALAKADENAGLHRRDFELLTANLIKRSPELPTPLANPELYGFFPDFLFYGTAAIVECDSREFHSTPSQRAADARKRRVLQHYGYRLLLLRWEQVAYYPEDGLARIIAHYRSNQAPPIQRPGPPPA